MGASIAEGGFDDDEEFAEAHEINVTPFIDVMLVLLIIFMIAAPLSTVDLPIDLPTSSAMPQKKPDKPTYVSIKPDLTVAIGENPVKRALVQQILARHSGAPALIIGQYLDQLKQIAAACDAPLITGKTAQRERERLYALFRTGELSLLVLSKVGNFALDLPDAEVLIQVSGTFGSRQEEAQRTRPQGGRSTVGSRGGGTVGSTG